MTKIDVIIIGGGPAGVSAALYTSRGGMATTIIHKGIGALEKAERIDNYYGTPGQTGPDLINAGLKQAATAGADIITGEVVKIVLKFIDGQIHFQVETADASIVAKTLLLATGANRQTPNIPGLAEYEGKGVSYCAVCDAFFYKGKNVAVLGNAQYALSEARELLPHVNSLTILTNGSELDVPMPPEVNIRKERITGIVGDTRLTGVTLESENLPLDGLFIAMGTAGATDLARKLGAFIENNAVNVNANMQTNVPALWAAGDCTGGMKQIAKAVYEGAIAGTDIVRHLRENKNETI